MNIGKYIFAQVIDFIPRYQFDKLVKKYKGDWHAKEDLTCYNHLGIRKSVNQSNLCRANEKRDYRIYEGLGIVVP